MSDEYWQMRNDLPRPGQGAEVLIVVRKGGIETVAAVFHDAGLVLESRTEEKPFHHAGGYYSFATQPSIHQLRITTAVGYEMRDFTAFNPKQIET